MEKQFTASVDFPGHLFVNKFKPDLLCGRQDGRPSALVQNQLTGTVAVLLKRGWLADSAQERHTFFAKVEHTAAASGDAGLRCSAMALLEVGLCSLLVTCHRSFSCSFFPGSLVSSFLKSQLLQAQYCYTIGLLLAPEVYIAQWPV